MMTLYELQDRLFLSVKQMDDLGVCCDGTPLTEKQLQAVEDFYNALDACRKNGLSRRTVFERLSEICHDPAIVNNDMVYEEMTVLEGACSADCIPRWRFIGEPEDDGALVRYVRDGQWKASRKTITASD